LTVREARQLVDEAPRLIDKIETSTLVGLRDRAIIALMGYAWAPLDAIVAMRVGDYYRLGERRWVRLVENETERRELVDRRLETHLDEYLTAARIANDPTGALFRATLGGNSKIAARPMSRKLAMLMIQHRIEAIVHPPEPLAKGGRGLAPYGADLQRLIDSIEPSTVTDMRDRAIIGLILYASASPRAIAALRVGDYYVQVDERWLKLIERAATPVISPLDSLLGDYLGAAQIGDQRTTSLFYLGNGNGDTPARPITPSYIVNLVRRRSAATGLKAPYRPVRKPSAIPQG